ncbi:uncharacterized protein PgNI_04512 [Pyricularia grisea]|uniref:Uncharacterized protein n=1 Tax=Pyricularia grisea TaxID=148305 RepID=A0A6P8BDI0_PYRGI|nr:uncharacterized protein PgNI_04512 [Pyricularia grisea]TLD13727.1 hypothetical protein PgNI_04512 [Pyricularia grisea]
MRFYVTAAVISALCSAVIATPGHGNTLAILEARQPVSKTAKSYAKERPSRAKECSQVGEYCYKSEDCCGTLLCGGDGCFVSKYSA